MRIERSRLRDRIIEARIERREKLGADRDQALSRLAPRVRRHRPIIASPAEVERLYRDGLSCTNIAEQLGCTRQSVQQFMARHGIASDLRARRNGRSQKRRT